MLTGINKELVCNTWMVHIMDGTCKYGRQNLQVCEHILKIVKNTDDVSNAMVKQIVSVWDC